MILDELSFSFGFWAYFDWAGGDRPAGGHPCVHVFASNALTARIAFPISLMTTAVFFFAFIVSAGAFLSTRKNWLLGCRIKWFLIWLVVTINTVALLCARNAFIPASTVGLFASALAAIASNSRLRLLLQCVILALRTVLYRLKLVFLLYLFWYNDILWSFKRRS